MNDPSRIIDAYLDGTLCPEDLAQLEEDLKDPGYADLFAQAMLVDTLLNEQLEREGIAQTMKLTGGSILTERDTSDANDSTAAALALAELAKLHEDGLGEPVYLQPTPPFSLHGQVSKATKRKARLIIAGGLAAVIAISAAVALVVSMLAQPNTNTTIVEQPADERIFVATLTDTHDAVWDQQKPGGDHRPGSSNLRPGTQLAVGQRLTLAQGFAEITTVRGAVALIEAPATIELIDNDNALYLHAGKLVGICETESSKGFLVRTAHMDITDLGTRFGVYAQDNQITTTVFTGEVELTAPGGEPQSLTRNQTARLNTHGNNRKLDVHDQLAKGFEKLQAMSLASALRNDPAMIAYWGFEAEDIVDGKLLNRAVATQGKMDGTLGQAGRPDSSPTLTEGRLPGTKALRFEAQEFDLVRISQQDAKAIDSLKQFTIGLWVRPDHMDQESHHLVTKRTVNGNVLEVLNFGLAWDGAGGGYSRNSVFFHSQPVGPGYTRSFRADTLVRESRWIHLALTFDRGERCLYIDGQLIERLPRQNTDRLASSDAELLLGASMVELDDPGTYLDGDLDELFILGRSMSADEVQALYGSGVPAE